MLKRIAVMAAALLLCLGILIGWFGHSTSPTVEKWRTIWIETAMTTGSHQWLATLFFPREAVDAAIAGRYHGEGVIGGEEFLAGSHPFSAAEDRLNQRALTVGEPDYAGYTVLINDTQQGIVVSEITGEGYRGRAVLVDDPSRLVLVNTPHPDKEGLYIRQYLDRYDAIAGIKAAGFSDVGSGEHGAHVVGMTRAEGKDWGEYITGFGSMVLTRDHHLVVGDIGSWGESIRCGIQFEPVLIADGRPCVEGSVGYGLQPRAAIGQRADGALILVVIDGRDLSHSLGCTVGDLAEIMLRYDALNAGCCDGDSSAVLAYNGKVITRSCAANPYTGRQLPNAFLIKRKEGTSS